MNWDAKTEIAKWNGQLDRLPAEVKKAVKDQMAKTATMAVARVQQSIPVGDKAPHLKDTIESRDGDSTKYEKIVSVGDSQLVYAMSLEFGHQTKQGGHVPPKRFFWPAIVIINKKHRAAMKRVIRKALKDLFPS